MTSLKNPGLIDFNTQFALPLNDDDDAIIVDLFAGGGGASTGLERGLGRQVAIAINHNPAAISMHEANHPHALHFETDVWEVDPIEETAGRVVGWLHASPDCRHFSQAAGGQPRKKEIRDLPWVTVKWAGKLRRKGKGPWVISLENVKQILQWGRLIAKRDRTTGRVVKLNGTVAAPGEYVPRHEQFLVPDPKDKGRTWRRFVATLRGFGYHVEWWVERNCDYGDPTTRQRLYLIATADELKPIAPPKSHAANPTKDQKKHRTAAECIDWSNLGKSIRNRKKPLAEATMRRIALGIQKEVIDRELPFIVPLTHQGSDRLHAVDEPFRTITAAHRGELALAVPSLIQVGYGEREGQAPRVPGLHKPLGTVMAGGGKHALATAFLAQANGGYNTTHSHPADVPFSTITNRGSQQQLVTANLVTLRKGSVGGPVDAPVGTLTGNDHHGLITADLVRQVLNEEQLEGATWCAAFLMKYHGTGANILSLDEPVSTITTKDRLALVTVWIGGDPYVIVDIRLRMLTPRELYRAQGFPDNYIIERGHDGRVFTLSEQVNMCGNSVGPNTMEAYGRANDPWRRRREMRLAA